MGVTDLHHYKIPEMDSSGVSSTGEFAVLEEFSLQRREEPQFSWSTSCHRSFFTDSPYFSSFMEKEMLAVKTELKVLDYIGSEFEDFSKAVGLFAKATRRLSSACKLKPESNENVNEEDVERKQNALGPDITATLECMGMLLEKIADAQEEFQATFQSPPVTLNLDVLSEVQRASMLKSEAESHTKDSEAMFSEFLNGKEKHENKLISSTSSFSSAFNNSFHWQEKLSNSSKIRMDAGDPLATEFTNTRNPLNMKSWSSKSREINLDDGSMTYSDGSLQNVKKEKISPKHPYFMRDDYSFNLRESDECSEAPSILGADLPIPMEADEEEIKKELAQSVELKQRLQNIRIGQTTAELKRFQFFKTLVQEKCERAYNVSQYIANFGRNVQSYTDTCSNIVKEQVLTLHRNEELNQKLHLMHQTNDKPMWDMRESLILDSLNRMINASNEATYDLNNIDALISSGLVGTRKFTWEETENEVKFWDLPSELVSCSRFLREPPPGVLMEGWLYRCEETESMLSKQLSWRRHWYILRYDGIFCLQHDKNTIVRNSGKSKKKNLPPEEERGIGESIVKVKICDVVLCTIKNVGEVPENRSSTSLARPRFCFELVVANQEPIVLQARGPKELQRWVDGIQSAIEDILVKGKANSPHLNRNIGEKTRCSELRRTVMRRGLSIFKLKCNKEEEEECVSCSSKLTSIPEDDASIISDTSEIESNHRHNRKLIKKVMEENPTCAECGEDSPDWVSLNLGVLVCLECGGVHRSLGVHVSQIRSLSLDSLSDNEAYVLLALGNARMNKIYERLITPEKKRIKPDNLSTRKTREEWIKSKYVKKRFVGLAKVRSRAEQKKRNEKISRLLHKAAKKADIVGVAQFLVHGANVDWDNAGRDKSALQICADLMKDGDNGRALLCAKVLVQNGATTDGLDDRSRRLLELNT